MTKRYENTDSAAGVVYPIALLAMVAAPVVLAYQAFKWLRLGTWPDITNGSLLGWLGAGRPTFSWRGVQTISDWIVDAPLSAGLFASGLLLAWVFSELGDLLQRMADRRDNPSKS